MSRGAAFARLVDVLVRLRRFAEGLDARQLDDLAKALEALIMPAQPEVTHGQLVAFAGSNWEKGTITRMWNVLCRENGLPEGVNTRPTVAMVKELAVRRGYVRGLGDTCRQLLVAWAASL